MRTIRLYPTCQLGVFVDDWTLEQVQLQRTLLQEFPLAAQHLIWELINVLKIQLSDVKAAITASSLTLAKVLRQDIGKEAGPPVLQAKRLGYDYAPGAQQHDTGQLKVRRERRIKAGAVRAVY